MLFVGNSLTYYNDLPGLVHAIDPQIATDSVTTGGAPLSAHWDAGVAISKIRQGHYTHIVLQERTYEPLTNPTGFHTSVNRFASLARVAGAQTVIFEAWAHRDPSDEMYRNAWSGGSPDAAQQLLLTQAHSVADETHSLLALPGEAFIQSRLVHPEIALYAPDGNHPSPAGTYLAACVITRVISGSPPSETSAVPESLPREVAAALRRAALRATL